MTVPKPIDRYAEMRAFVAEWYRPIKSEDGYSELEIAEAETRIGFRFPQALQEMYSLFGKWDDLFDDSTELVPPVGLENRSFYDAMAGDEEWLAEEDRDDYPVCMPIYADREGLSRFVVLDADLSLNDPIVYLEDDEELYEQGIIVSTQSPVSRFVFVMLAYGILYRHSALPEYEPDGKSAPCSDENLRHTLTVMNQSPVLLWGSPWHFYHGKGVVAATQDGKLVKVVAKDSAVLNWFVEQIQAV